MKRTLLLLLCVWMATFAAAQPDPRPKVRLTFVVDAAGVRGRLGSELTASVSEVQAEAKKVLEGRFPYFEWVVEGEAANALTLTLSERQAPFDIEHLLTYTGSVGAGPAPAHVLYDQFTQPPLDTAALRASLLKKVPEDVTKSLAALNSYFASHVSLVRRVGLESKSILLPVAGVHPQSASFLVSFLDADAAEGVIRLSQPLESPAKGLFCRIDNFRYPPAIDAAWDDAIPAVLNTKARTFEVKVQDFTPKAHQNTTGGSVTSLGGGSR